MLGNLFASRVLGPDVQVGRSPGVEVRQTFRPHRMPIPSSGAARSVALQGRGRDWIGDLLVDDGQAVLRDVDCCPFLELFPVQWFAPRRVVHVCLLYTSDA